MNYHGGRMCLQCSTKSETVIGDVIPNFSLCRSNKTVISWPVGWYGLVQCNDPDIIFPGPILGDPYDGWTDEQIENDEKNSETWTKFWDFYNYVDGIRKFFRVDPEIGYHFVKSCEIAGYNIKEDGDVLMWFITYVHKKLNN